jgi:hypothetical protein
MESCSGKSIFSITLTVIDSTLQAVVHPADPPAVCPEPPPVPEHLTDQASRRLINRGAKIA